MRCLDQLFPYEQQPESLDRLLTDELAPQALEEARQAIRELGREADRQHHTKQDAVAVGILAGWRLCTRFWLSSNATLPEGFRERLQHPNTRR